MCVVVYIHCGCRYLVGSGHCKTQVSNFERKTTDKTSDHSSSDTLSEAGAMCSFTCF